MIRFQPWVGKNYVNENPWNFPLMILGESHYDTDNKPQRGFTEFVVDRWVNHPEIKYRSHLFSKTARLVTSAWQLSRDIPNQEHARCDTRAFWNNVLFYNFVQNYLPNVRMKPTEKMWTDSVTAFIEVIHQYQPAMIIVLGKRLMAALPSTDAMRRFSVELVAVNHPSSRGWKYGDWLQDVEKAFRNTTT